MLPTIDLAASMALPELPPNPFVPAALLPALEDPAAALRRTLAGKCLIVLGDSTATETAVDVGGLLASGGAFASVERWLAYVRSAIDKRGTKDSEHSTMSDKVINTADAVVVRCGVVVGGVAQRGGAEARANPGGAGWCRSSC